MELAFSVYLYWAGILATGTALLAYLALVLRPVLARAFAPSLLAATQGGVPWFAPPSRAAPARPFGTRIAALTVWLAVASLGSAAVARTIETGHAPFSNLFEYSMAFALGLSAVWALAERRTPARAAGLLVMGAAFGLAASALAWPSTPQDTLVPALQAGWVLPVHVGTMLLSYSLLGVAGAAAALYLVQAPERRFMTLPGAEELDALAATAVKLGFVVLAAGVALGAYWAGIAWGRYWGWDPKETSALVTWLLFAVYLHTRGLQGWQGRRGALLILIGFGAVLFTYLGVNLWITGLHSYAGV